MELALYARLPLWYTTFLTDCLKRSLRYRRLDCASVAQNRLFNPFALPSGDRPEAILVTWDFHHHLQEIGLDGPFYREVERLNRPLIALENQDLFHLKFAPADCRRFDLILKAQGVYRDLDLYNYRVGGRYGPHWTAKASRLTPAYCNEDLRKIRVSFPVFVVRTSWIKRLRTLLRRMAGRLGRRGEDATVCFYAAMNHMRRYQALQVIRRSGVSYCGGLVNYGDINIAGHEEILGRRNELLDLGGLYARIAAEDLWIERLNGWSYARALHRSRAVLAVAGHGELGVRHLDALENGRLLVCQDLRHAEILYPFRPGENVVFCAHDLSDLSATLRDVEARYAPVYHEIARQGRKDWQRWARDRTTILQLGFWEHVAGLLGRPAPLVKRLEDPRRAKDSELSSRYKDQECDLEGETGS